MRAATAHLRRDRASRLIACLGLSVTVCLACLGVYLIQDLRDGAWHRAEQNAENLLGMIEEGVARNVQLYDLSLQAAARGALRKDVLAIGPELRREVLFDHAATASGLGTIAVADAQGQVQITSDPGAWHHPSLGDLPEFQRLKADPEAGLVITGPRPSRTTGRPIMALSRAIHDPDGSFAGMVSGTIDLAYFQSLFARLHIDDGSFVNIFHQDGTRLVRQPAQSKPVGASIAAGEAYRRYRAQTRGLFVGTSLLDGKERLYAFANLEGLPLIVNVAVGVDSIRAAWLSKAVGIAVLILGLGCVMLGLTFVLQKEVSRRAAAEASSQAANAALSRLALTDSLTGLANRRRYDEAFAEAWRRAGRSRASISLLLLDADHFKQFNDHFGHRRGDETLQAVARCMERHLGGLGALPCRIGGEEFAVILPDTRPEAAQAIAEAIRREFAARRTPHAPEIGGVATISIGVAHRVPSGRDGPETLFAEADAALYEAKRAGRNRVRVAAQSAPGVVPLARSA